MSELQEQAINCTNRIFQLHAILEKRTNSRSTT